MASKTKKPPMTKNKIELMKWIMNNSKDGHDTEKLSSMLMPELKKIKRDIVNSEKSLMYPKKQKVKKQKVKNTELSGTTDEAVILPSKMTYNRLADNSINNNEISSVGTLDEKNMTIDDITFNKKDKNSVNKYLTAVTEIKNKSKENKKSGYIPHTDSSVKTYAQIIESFNKQP